MAFVATCSCGFRSEPQATSAAAIDAYRVHEWGHDPGQRTGEIVQVRAAPAKADESPAGASRKGAGRKAKPPAPAEAPTTERAVW